ncbi:MAG: outer membrane beta-barrel protein [Bacteroides sp.]|nr:outer membrane beta-barrel protein [Bacteroides sp.]
MLFTLLLLLPIFLYAQSGHSVKGMVQDADGKPLEGATIRLERSLPNQQLTGATTDIHGRFALQANEGTYSLEISYMGYSKYMATVQVDGEVRLPAICLQEETLTTDEVVITARTITYRSSGYIAEISRNPNYREQDMNSVLKLTPGTYTTQTAIQVYGQEVSKVYLNGRPLNLSGLELINYLESLEGKSVKRLEVVASAGVEEDGSAIGSSIIKITTADADRGGMMSIGTHSMLYGYNGKYAHIPSANLNLRLNEKWGVYFRGGLTANKIPRKTQEETRFHDTGERLLNEASSVYSVKKSYNALGGISYDLNASNLFSAEFSCSTRNMQSHAEDITHHLTEEQRNIRSEGYIDGGSDYRTAGLSLSYIHRFGRNGTVSILADRWGKQSNEWDNNAYTYTADRIERMRNSLYKGRERMHTAQANYSQQFDFLNAVLQAGLKYTDIANEYTTNYTYSTKHEQENESAHTDLYTYNEKVYAAYAKYTFAWAGWELDFGLRAEHTRLSPRSSTNPERNRKNNYTQLLPEAGVNYTLNKERGHNLSLEYTRSLQRPMFQYLNPLMRRVNEYSYSTGNPLLEATLTDHYGLRLTMFHRYTLFIRHSHSKNELITIAHSNDGIIHSSPHLGAHHAVYRIYADFPIKLGSWGELKGSVNYRHASQSYQEESIKSDCWTFGLTSLCRLPGTLQLLMNCRYSTPERSLYTKTKQGVQAEISLSQTFFQRRLNATIRLHNLFNARSKTTASYATHTQTFRTLSSDFKVYLNLRYTLRWGEKQQVRKGESGNSNERMRY